MADTPQYRDMDEKIQNVERYLIQQVDSLKRWMLAVVVLCGIAALGAVSAVWITLGSRTEPAAVAARVAEETDTANTMSETPGDEDRAPEEGEVRKAEDDATAPTAAAKSGEKAAKELMASAEPAVSRKEAPETQAPKEPEPKPKRSETAPAPKPEDASPVVPADPGTAGATQESAAKTTTPEKSIAEPEKAIDQPEKSIDEPETAPTVTRQPASTPDDASGDATSPGWSFRLGASAIAKEIVSLEPVGASNTFAPDTPHVFCWTRIETDNLNRIPPDQRFVIHRWTHGGKVFHERKITIGSPRYRVHSMLANPGQQRGVWRVEIVDGQGRKLGVVPFVVE